MMEEHSRTPEQLESCAREIANKLIYNSVRPVVELVAIEQAVATSLREGSPLRCRIVLCPNWYVGKKGRAVREIPVYAGNNNIDIQEPESKIVGLLTEEVPNLVSFLNKQGLAVELLVVLADILSPNWVHDPRTAKENLAQNQRAIKLLLMSSNLGKEVFNNKSKAHLKVVGQLNQASRIPAYEKRLIDYQVEALTGLGNMHQWYMAVLTKLLMAGEYQDKRTDLTSLRKIWDRCLFLAAMYALDGEIIEADFDVAGFPKLAKSCGYLALGTVATVHGDVIGEGWNRRRERKVGVVTPFNNAMEHTWSETRLPAVKL